MATVDRLAELEELRLVEERLLQERTECEKLENQIRSLTLESKRVEADVSRHAPLMDALDVGGVPPPPPPPAAGPRRAPPPPPPAGDSGMMRAADCAITAASEPTGSAPDTQLATLPHTPASAPTTFATPQSGSPPTSRGRSKSPMRKKYVPPSTMGSSSRFMSTHASDTPGPGMYDSAVTTFGSRKVKAKSPAKGKPEAATPSPVAKKAPSKGTPSSAKQTLDAALRRERQLRRDLTTAHQNMQQQQQNLAQYQAQVRQQIDRLTEEVGKKKSAYEASQRNVASWRGVHNRVVDAFQGLRRCMKEYAPLFEQSAHAARFRDLQNCVRSVDEALEAATPLTKLSTSSSSHAMAPSGRDRLDMPGVLVDAASPMASPATPRGVLSPVELESKGISAADVASFAQQSRKRSIAIKHGDDARVAYEKSHQAISGFHGIDATRVQKHLVRSTPSPVRALARKSQSPVPSRSPAAGRATKGVVDRLAVAGRATSPPRSKAGSKAPETLDEQLRRIFQHYCSYGDRNNTTNMTDFKMAKVLRDAGVLDNRVSFHDADLIYTKVTTKQHNTAVSDGVKVPGATAAGRRMSYDQFVEALTLIAAKKYRAEISNRADCFRMLLLKHLMPLATRLDDRMASLDEAEVTRREFSDKFLKPEILKFFNDYRASIQSLFTRYSMMDTPTGPYVSWASIRESASALSLNEFQKFCADFGITKKVRRPEISRLFSVAAERLIHEGVEAELAYPEFCELLGMLADFMFRYEERPGMPTSLLFRVQSLFYYMHQAGGHFHGPEAKLVRVVTKTVKQALAERSKAAEVTERKETEKTLASVKDVLAEGF